MTRRQGDDPLPWDDFDAVLDASDAYRRAFGEGPPAYAFRGMPGLARAIAAATAAGERLTTRTLAERLGVEPPPDEAII